MSLRYNIEVFYVEYISSFEYLLCTLEIVCIIITMFSIAATPQSTISFFLVPILCHYPGSTTMPKQETIYKKDIIKSL